MTDRTEREKLVSDIVRIKGDFDNGDVYFYRDDVALLLKALSLPNPDAVKSDREIVGWSYELATWRDPDGTYGRWVKRLSHEKPNAPDGSIRYLEPLIEIRVASPPDRDAVIEEWHSDGKQIRLLTFPGVPDGATSRWQVIADCKTEEIARAFVMAHNKVTPNKSSTPPAQCFECDAALIGPLCPKCNPEYATPQRDAVIDKLERRIRGYKSRADFIFSGRIVAGELEYVLRSLKSPPSTTPADGER